MDRKRITYAQLFKIAKKLEAMKNYIMAEKPTYQKVAKMVSEDLGFPVPKGTLIKQWEAVFPETPWPRSREAFAKSSDNEGRPLRGGYAYAKLALALEQNEVLIATIETMLDFFKEEEILKDFKASLEEVKHKFKLKTFPRGSVTPLHHTTDPTLFDALQKEHNGSVG